MNRKFFWLVLLLLLTTGRVFSQDAGLQVDVSQDLGPISPYLFGANAQQSVITPDNMPTAQAMGLKILRLGGGPSDQSDLSKPAVDFFIVQARQLGAEPLVTVRLLNGSPEKAAEMVRYANITKKYNIKYWSIGNEPNFFVAVLKAKSYTTEDLTKNWRAIAEAMKAVDPNIILVGPDISQYVVLNADSNPIQYLEGNGGGDPTDDLGKDWMQEFLKANGDLIGVVSIHRYPYPGGKPTNTATIDGLRANSREWETIIPNLRKIINRSTGRDIPIAVTEFNSNSSNNMGGEASLDSHYNGIWTAVVLGHLIRQKVDMALYWNIQTKGNGFGLIGNGTLRPSYYAYVMYSHLGTELLGSESADQDVTITAAKTSDGKLTLMVINLASAEKQIALNLKGNSLPKEADVWLFDKDHKAENIGMQDLTGGVLTLPAESVTLYVFSGTE
jgi:alpha-L-arabinofuranosidase